MSFEAMAWAYRQQPEAAPEVTGASLHHVLLGLANYAHDGEEPGVHMTWVAIKRLAEELCMGERTVRRAIEALEEQHLLVRTRRRRADGSWSTYVYALPVASVAAGTTGQDGRWVEPPAEHQSAEPPASVAAHEPQASTTSEPQPIAKVRQRDLLFEAVAEACGIEWRELPKSATGPLARTVAELRAVGAEPAEVHRRAGEYHRRWTVPLTPTALLKHWAALGTEEPLRLSIQTAHPTDVATMAEMERLRGGGRLGRPARPGAGQPSSGGLPGDTHPGGDAEPVRGVPEPGAGGGGDSRG